MSRTIYNAKNNAQTRPSAGGNASVLTLPITSGDGVEFPVGYQATTTSAGTSTTLNRTGIQAELSAIGITTAGFWIRNLTDGSIAWVKTIGTNSLTTTPLKGGTGNDWGNGDEIVVGSFIATIEKRDVDGVVTAYELVKAKYCDNANDSIYIESGGRGFDGTTPASFTTGDYIVLNVDANIIANMLEIMGWSEEEKTDLNLALLKDGSVAMTGDLDMGSQSITNLADGVADGDAVNKGQLNALGADFVLFSDIFGDGSDGAFAESTGTTNLTLGTVYEYESLALTGDAKISTVGNNGVLIIKVKGACTIADTAKIDLKGKGAAGGAGRTTAGTATNGTTASASFVFDGLEHGGKGGVSSASNGYGASGGAGILASIAVSSGGASATPILQAFGLHSVFPGSGGGGGAGVAFSGGTVSTAPTGGAGGAGILLLVGGNLTLGGGGIDCSGAAGESGTGSAGTGGYSIGGSGGGAGGCAVVLVKGTLAGSPSSVNVAGGAGGSGVGTTAGTGGSAGTQGFKILSKYFGA